MNISKFLSKSYLPVLFVFFYSLNLLSDWWLVQFSGAKSLVYRDWDYVLQLPYFCNSDKRSDWLSLLWEGLGEECPEHIYGFALLLIMTAFAEFFFLPSLLLPSAIFLGLLLCFAFALVLTTRNTRSPVKTFLLVLVMFSPALIFLFERANFDLVMALLILLASWTFSKNLYLLTSLVIFLSAILKFYTLPLLWLVVFLVPGIRIKVTTSLIATFGTAVVVRDLVAITGIPDGGLYQFGLSSIGHYFDILGLPLAIEVSIGLGAAIPLFLAIFLYRANKNLPKLSEVFHNRGVPLQVGFVLSVFSSVVFLSCYFAGLSFDYRLIFLAMAALPYLDSVTFTGIQERRLWVTLLLAFWGSSGLAFSLLPNSSFFIRVLILGFQALGDFAVMIWVGILITGLYRFSKDTFLASRETKKQT